MFYCKDTSTGKQSTLRTKDECEAESLLSAKNEAIRQPAMNLQIAQVYLQQTGRVRLIFCAPWSKGWGPLLSLSE